MQTPCVLVITQLIGSFMLSMIHTRRIGLALADLCLAIRSKTSMGITMTSVTAKVVGYPAQSRVHRAAMILSCCTTP